MEAAASAVPIVATDIRGSREVVDHGRTGLLVRPRDAAALEAAIGRLVDDVPVRRRLGEAAAAKASREFDQRRVIARTLDAYAGLNG
jgi:glycosyltransferase involved in cell wall biosynthesis